MIIIERGDQKNLNTTFSKNENCTKYVACYEDKFNT